MIYQLKGGESNIRVKYYVPSERNVKGSLERREMWGNLL